ncbi:MAG: DUF1949 domain-containing protein, partial [Clostridia bacterium]|nr:DUF1949 domain-containing protein [Clostridia bacterium]
AVDYPRVDGALKFFAQNPCEVLSSDYGNEVTYTVLVKKSDVATFTAALTDFLSGRVTYKSGKEYYYPFKA